MGMLNRPVPTRFLGLLVPLLFAVQGPTIASITSLTVTGPEPGCDDPVQIAVEGYFPDACWEVTGIEPWVNGQTLGLVIHAIDHWEPSIVCGQVIVEYAWTETFGPLPLGKYWAVAQEEVVSERDPEGDFAWLGFSACCPPAPDSVTGLQLEKTDGGNSLRFTWIDVAGAVEYSLYMDSTCDGDFNELVGTATSGVTGIEAPTATLLDYFLVAPSNGCAEGPMH